MIRAFGSRGPKSDLRGRMERGCRPWDLKELRSIEEEAAECVCDEQEVLEQWLDVEREEMERASLLLLDWLIDAYIVARFSVCGTQALSDRIEFRIMLVVSHWKHERQQLMVIYNVLAR